MPNFCAVVGCGSTSLRDYVSFYSFPSNHRRGYHKDHPSSLDPIAQERRKMWLHSLHRKDMTEKKMKNERVCSRHFVTGKPALLEDRNHPDWVPTLHMGYKLGDPSSSKRKIERCGKSAKKNIYSTESLPKKRERSALEGNRKAKISVDMSNEYLSLDSDVQQKCILEDWAKQESKQEKNEFTALAEINTNNRTNLVTLDVELLKKIISAINRLKDDCCIFGDFVANQLRSISAQHLRMKLQCRIQKSILRIAEEDEQLLQ